MGTTWSCLFSLGVDWEWSASGGVRPGFEKRTPLEAVAGCGRTRGLSTSELLYFREATPALRMTRTWERKQRNQLSFAARLCRKYVGKNQKRRTHERTICRSVCGGGFYWAWGH